MVCIVVAAGPAALALIDSPELDRPTAALGAIASSSSSCIVGGGLRPEFAGDLRAEPVSPGIAMAPAIGLLLSLVGLCFRLPAEPDCESAGLGAPADAGDLAAWPGLPAAMPKRVLPEPDAAGDDVGLTPSGALLASSAGTKPGLVTEVACGGDCVVGAAAIIPEPDDDRRTGDALGAAEGDLERLLLLPVRATAGAGALRGGVR